MLTQSERPAPVAVSGTSPKLRQLLRRRLRQLLRVTLVLAIGLAVAASALAIWWLTSLNGLPDIGDPFDVAAFRAFSIPDDQNAFTFLRRAEEKLTPSPPSLPLLVPGGSDVAGVGRGESQGDRTVSARGRPIRRREPGRRIRGEWLNAWRCWSCLEADRRQASGDMAGAWDCYRAILRMATHTRRRGSLNRARRPLLLLGRFVAATARDLGGRSEDLNPPASWCPGRSAQERAEARLGSVCDESGIPGYDALAGAAGPYLRPAGGRLGISLSPG